MIRWNSSQLDTISVKTSDNVTLGYSIAGLGSRLVAQILDNLLAVPLTLVAILLYGALASVVRHQHARARASPVPARDSSPPSSTSDTSSWPRR